MKRHFLKFSVALALSALLTASSFAQDQFQTLNEIPAGLGYSIKPLLGDYDGDGDMDILGTGTYVRNSTSNNATVLLRNDGGNFVSVDLDLPWFYYGGMYQWADIDNDNDLDIIAGGCTSYCYNTKMLSIYRNDGADTFSLVTQPTNLIGGKLFTLIDFDNDGLIDIEIATQSDNNDDVIGHTFYRNTGNFVFQKTFELPVVAGELTWADLDNDGWKDFVLLNKAYKNLQNGTFQAFTSPLPLQSHARHFFLDADRDGDLDVITSNGIFMMNDGSGHLSFHSVIIPYSFINSLLIADFDGDGDQDMVASGGTGSVPNLVSKTQLFRCNGAMSFTAEDLNERYTQSYSLAIADMDRDNDPDIVLSGVFASKIVILENGLTTELTSPLPPQNLQTSVNAGTIIFSWNAATDQEQASSSLSYNMYLMRDDAFRVAPNADPVTGTSFIPGTSTIAALQKQLSASSLPEGYYRWSVQSTDDELNTSAFAAQQEFTFYTNNPANAPTNLTLSAVTGQTASITWADNSSDETGFTIERSSVNGNSGFEPIHQTALNAITYTDNTVTARTVYYYRIRLDGSAAVAYSNVIRIETPAAIAISPANVTATALTSASVKIDWQYAGTGITGFVIERSPDDKKHFSAVGSVSDAIRTYTDQQLVAGRTYYYRLFAVNGEDVSDYSNTINITLPLKEFNTITLPSLMYDSRYIMGGIAWGDYDNDGHDDLFLGYKAQLYQNKGDGTFEKISETGIIGSVNAYDFVAVWGDYDNDGFLDLYYYDNESKSSVYRGHGDGTFVKITTLISTDRSDIRNASWTDIDMDGDLDLSMTGGRYVYRYDGNDTFVRVDFPGGIPAGYYTSSVASWADFDDDGDPDVFLGNHGKDELLSNNGDGTFTSITDQRVTVDYNYDCCPIATPTALWTDFNNDRKLDLTVLHVGSPVYGYANHANTLDSAFYFYEYDAEGWKNLSWTDYDNDGDLDLFIMGQYNHKTTIWENKDGQFRQLKGGPLYDYVSTDANFAWNDFDNDGYSDLFQFDENHQVHKNLSNGNNWTKIRLKGRSSNSTGLGAKVFVKSNGGWQRSDVTTHHSYRVQQGFMSLFGIGNATKVDSVKIIWPTGNRQYLTNVSVNQVILIDEDDAQEVVAQAPSNLTAQAEFPSSLILTWKDRSEDETGFVIEMKTGEGQFVQVGTVGANVTSFKVNGLTTGVIYQFRVQAALANKWSNVVEAQIRLFTEVFGGDLTVYQSRSEGMSWGDPDDDGDPDLFVGSQSFEPDALYYNNNGIFTRTALRATSSYSRQANWIDYDNDGYQDLHVSVGGGIGASPESLNDILYKNNKSGQLIEQTGHLLAQDGAADYSAAWGDLNKDGYLDMVVSRTDGKGIYLNLGGNFIQQEAPELEVAKEQKLLLSDIDNDRDPDLLTNSFNHNNSVYRNLNGQFTSSESSALPYAVIALVVEDFDNDGTQDVLAINQNQTLSLFLLDPVSNLFKEKGNVFPETMSISRLSAGDFDNNGFIDVFATGNGMIPPVNKIFLNSGNLKFTSLSDPILELNLSGTALADVNSDGHLDVVTLATDNFSDSKRYLLQGTSNENHWLRIKLKGVTTNTYGIGAKLRLFTGDKNQVREFRSGSGGTFSDEQIAHFGLGTASAVAYIKVEWSSGEDQWIANPPIDTELTIEQASSTGPPAPTSASNLTATRLDPGYIGLQWTDNSNNEKFFRIERAVGSNDFELFRYVPANATSYTDSAFTDYSGTRLDIKYRVVAVSYVSVESAPSNVASIFVITGIDDELNGLSVYPQPATGRVIVRGEREIQNITIMSVRGEPIQKLSVGGLREVEITLAGFTPGIYFLQITEDTGKQHVRKLLVVSNN
jgi:hypothetical protein